MKLNYFFIHNIIPVILKECVDYNFLPSVIIAQSIIHSSVGTSELFKNANNIFAIKINNEWINLKRDTYRFRKKVNERYYYYKLYKNYEESVHDYFKKINMRQHNFLYENYDFNNVVKNIFLNNRKPTEEYTKLLTSVIEENNLDEYDIYVTNISTMGRALIKLEKYDILDGISYWFNAKAYIDNIDKLLINASNKIKISNKTNKVDLFTSIYKFYNRGIISTNEITYWKNACEINSRLSELIKDIAVYL